MAYSYIANAKEGADPGRNSPAQISYETLKQIYINPRESERIKNLWEERHRGKFIEWEMVILEVNEDGTLELAGSRTADEAEAVLTLKHPEQVEEQALKEEKTITFSAALVDWEGNTFNLELGLLLDDEE